MESPIPQIFGTLVIDLQGRKVTVDGQTVQLTRAEYKLLSVLTEQPGRAFSWEELVHHLTGTDWFGGNHSLQMCVSRLRTKLGESGTHPRQIVTVHGYGYRFEPDVSSRLSSSMLTPDPSHSRVDDDLPLYMLVSFNRLVLWASANSTRVIGWQPHELEGSVLYELMHPDDQPLARSMREELDAGLPAAVVVRLRDSSGDFRSLEALARPIISRNGVIEAFLGGFRTASMNRSSPSEPLSAIRFDIDE